MVQSKKQKKQLAHDKDIQTKGLLDRKAFECFLMMLF